MFVQTEAGQQGEIFHLPFILCKSAGNLHVLFQITLITRHHIMQGIILIFDSSRKSSRRKETVVHIPHIHGSAYDSQVLRSSVSIRIHTGTIVTVAVRMLC